MYYRVLIIGAAIFANRKKKVSVDAFSSSTNSLAAEEIPNRNHTYQSNSPANKATLGIGLYKFLETHFSLPP